MHGPCFCPPLPSKRTNMSVSSVRSLLDPIPFFPLVVTKSQETQKPSSLLVSSSVEYAFLSQLLTARVVRPAHGAYLGAPAALGACRRHPSPAPLLQHQGGWLKPRPGSGRALSCSHSQPVLSHGLRCFSEVLRHIERLNSLQESQAGNEKPEEQAGQRPRGEQAASGSERTASVNPVCPRFLMFFFFLREADI